MRAGQRAGRVRSLQVAAASLLAVVLLVFGGAMAAIGGSAAAQTHTAGPANATAVRTRAAHRSVRVVGGKREAAIASRATTRPSGPHGGHRANLTLVPRGWATSNHTLVAGGIERHYLMLRPPATVTGTIPVVIVLPGRAMDPDEIERTSRLIPVVGNAIMVYPAGYGRSWNAGGCCGRAHRADVNDVRFLNDVIHQVLGTQPDASSHDIYLMGFSNGGRMAYRMACADPGAFAGVAAVEAVPVYDCRHFDPTPLAIVAQSADPLLTIATDGHRKTMQGYLEPTVGATVAQYRSLEGCAVDPSLTSLGDARVTTFAHCRGTGRLEYVLYGGGAHIWPEGNVATPSGGELIWSFLHHGARPILARAGTHPGHHRLT
jgi:polyhydroxybutyrate depolymerase